MEHMQLSIVMKHSGVWNDENKYVDYQLDSIAMEEIKKYDKLLELIANQLSINLGVEILKIEYKVDFNSKRMKIHNDMWMTV